MRATLRHVVQGGVLVALVAGLVSSVWAESTAAPSWPDFHGPGRHNISPETNLLRRWPAEGPPLLWEFTAAGRGYSGVTVAEGKIFTAGDFDDVESLVALSLDGKLLWKAANGEAWLRTCPGARATPTYHAGRLYHLTPLGRLAAFEAATGKELWHVDLQQQFDAEYGVWGLSENVLVENGRVFCMPGGPKGRVVALDAQTGRTLWANTAIEHTAAYCSPTVVDYGGVRQLLTLTQKSIVSVAVDSGKLLWSHPFVPKSPQNATTPVFQDGYVFIACGHWSGGTVLKVAPDFSRVDEVWYHRELDSCHGGAILLGDRLYGCSCRMGGKQLFCVDFRSGELLHADKTLSKVALTAADGMLYCLNHRGKVSLLKTTPEGFTIESQFDLPKKPDNSYLAHPVICGGRLYLRCDDQLWAFDIADKSSGR